ncbi:hypothetical protein MRB53_007677 [Persea americana]|uniref:Uncharacterized protein n=1 Tax=Persea americana TaxID=3435 RepID=A0ACC2MKR6_PERAE|nr:hypothetical protein MRB53_007677 [Persea americana]
MEASLSFLTEGRIISLFGEDDLGWIKKFISTMKAVVKREGIALELIYVGKKHRDSIIKENLSESFVDDKTLKHLMMLLGADGSGQGWATLGYGSDDMAVLNENMAMESREIG